MGTLRKELVEKGFDWKTGRVIIWEITEGWGWRGKKKEDVVVIKGNWEHKYLDHEYGTGYGKAECPCFIAEDTKNIYLPAQHDGTTWLYKVSKDVDYYLTHVPPYEGR